MTLFLTSFLKILFDELEFYKGLNKDLDGRYVLKIFNSFVHINYTRLLKTFDFFSYGNVNLIE